MLRNILAFRRIQLNLFVLAIALCSSIASARDVDRLETRVGVFDLAAHIYVGAAHSRFTDNHRAKSIAYGDLASGNTLAAEGVEATLDLAMTIQGSSPLSAQTIAILETAEGQTLVGAGTADLTQAQIALARANGLTPTALPGFHAEQTVINRAAELGLTPTRGVTTNNICGARCGALIQEIGGWFSGKHFGF